MFAVVGPPFALEVAHGDGAEDMNDSLAVRRGRNFLLGQAPVHPYHTATYRAMRDTPVFNEGCEGTPKSPRSCPVSSLSHRFVAERDALSSSSLFRSRVYTRK